MNLSSNDSSADHAFGQGCAPNFECSRVRQGTLFDFDKCRVIAPSPCTSCQGHPGNSAFYTGIGSGGSTYQAANKQLAGGTCCTMLQGQPAGCCQVKNSAPARVDLTNGMVNTLSPSVPLQAGQMRALSYGQPVITGYSDPSALSYGLPVVDVNQKLPNPNYGRPSQAQQVRTFFDASPGGAAGPGCSSCSR